MSWVNNNGLSYFWAKCKAAFAAVGHSHSAATQSAAGYMSASDKKKLDGVATGATSNTGTVTSVATGAGLTGGTITGSGTVKAKLKSETAHTASSATPGNTSGRQYAVGVDKDGYLSVNVPWENTAQNQNAFSNVTVGSTTVSADSATDTLTLVAGSNVTLTPDATNDKVTIAATDTTYSAGSGLDLSGTTLSAKVDDDTIKVNAQGQLYVALPNLDGVGY